MNNWTIAAIIFLSLGVGFMAGFIVCSVFAANPKDNE